MVYHQCDVFRSSPWCKLGCGKVMTMMNMMCVWSQPVNIISHGNVVIIEQ